MRSPAFCVGVAALLALVSCSRVERPASPENEAARFNGTWTGDGGEFKLWAIDDRRLQVEFRGQYEYDSAAGRMVNVGEADGIASVNEDGARLQPQGAGGDCTITLRASGDRLDATESGFCGFGLNVTAEGRYQRVSRDRPSLTAPPRLRE